MVTMRSWLQTFVGLTEGWHTRTFTPIGPKERVETVPSHIWGQVEEMKMDIATLDRWIALEGAEPEADEPVQQPAAVEFERALGRRVERLKGYKDGDPEITMQFGKVVAVHGFQVGPYRADRADSTVQQQTQKGLEHRVPNRDGPTGG